MLQFEFALSSRMQAYLDLKKACVMLQKAYDMDCAYMYLLAASDLRISVLAEAGRKSALLELAGLFESSVKHFKLMIAEHPEYSADVQYVCEELEEHGNAVQKTSTIVSSYLSNQELLSRYSNALKKLDVLGHNIALPETIDVLWKRNDFAAELLQRIAPIVAAIRYLDGICSNYAPWSDHVARNGCDELQLDRKHPQGLLIVGLDSTVVNYGVIPDVVASRYTAKLRFQHTNLVASGEKIAEQAYKRMLIPIA